LVILAADREVHCEVDAVAGGRYAEVLADGSREIELPAGDYTLVASKAAHEPYRHEGFALPADDRLTVKVPPLAPLRGTLQLDVQPAGGEVSLRQNGTVLPGYPRKAQDMRSDELLPGEYQVTVECDGYELYESAVTIAPAQPTQHKAVLRQLASLTLRCGQAGVQAWIKPAIGGPPVPVPVGGKPFKLRAAQYRLAATKDGCSPWKSDVTLQPGERIALDVVFPEPPPLVPVEFVAETGGPPDRVEIRDRSGRIVAESQNPGPNAVLQVRQGFYSLRATKNGMEDFVSREFQAATNATPKPIEVRFSPKSTPASNVVFLLYATEWLVTMPDLQPEIQKLLQGVLTARADRIYGKRAWIVHREGDLVGWDVASPLPLEQERKQRFQLEDPLWDAFDRGKHLAAKQLAGSSIGGELLINIWASPYEPHQHKAGKDEPLDGWLLWFGARCDDRRSVDSLSRLFEDWAGDLEPKRYESSLRKLIDKHPSLPSPTRLP